MTDTKKNPFLKYINDVPAKPSKSSFHDDSVKRLKDREPKRKELKKKVKF